MTYSLKSLPLVLCGRKHKWKPWLSRGPGKVGNGIPLISTNATPTVGVDAIDYLSILAPGAKLQSPLDFLVGVFTGAMISGFGFMLIWSKTNPERALKYGTRVMVIMLVILGSFFAFTAMAAIYTGHISVGKTHAVVVSKARHPGIFWCAVGFHFALAGFIFRRLVKSLKG